MTIDDTYSLGDLELQGNLGTIDPSDLAWLPSLPASASDDEIRHELETKGVVHLRGVMPRQYVQETREKYFSFMAPTGILALESNPTDGLWVGGREPNDFVTPASAGYLPSANPVATANIAHAWKVDTVKRLKPEWSRPFCFQRQIWRTNIPGAKGTSTGVHYDHIFLRHGPPTALTAWVPVGDCSPLMGGLVYLENSVQLGYQLEEEFMQRAIKEGFTPEVAKYAFNSNMMATGMLSLNPGDFGREVGNGRRWLIGDYSAGDVVFHHPMMIHASSGNHDPAGRIRLSTDLRYGDRLHEYDARWDQAPHRPNDGL